MDALVAGIPVADGESAHRDMVRKLGDLLSRARAANRLHERDVAWWSDLSTLRDAACLRRRAADRDAEFLRLVFQLMRHYSIDPARLIHALQNHDELTMGLAHFAGHADDPFHFAAHS